VFISLSVCVCVSHCVGLYFSVCVSHSVCLGLSGYMFCMLYNYICVTCIITVHWFVLVGIGCVRVVLL